MFVFVLFANWSQLTSLTSHHYVATNAREDPSLDACSQAREPKIRLLIRYLVMCRLTLKREGSEGSSVAWVGRRGR
ncbi:hypothetical protein F5Y03DRAFT_370680 [Xylaria venustula]|nr:hypothetical protein F5Y03DRAFT_370680 [Xylaria venustula]